MKFILYATVCALCLTTPVISQAPKAPGKAGPKKELTREEIAKLGGFEPAPDAPLDKPVNLQIDLQIFALPEAEALPIIEALKDPLTIEKTLTMLRGMVLKKTAKLIALPSVITKPGNRAVVEMVDEVRYPIEFEPMDNKAPDAAAKAGADAARPDAKAKDAANVKGVLPTTFETRNVGVTLEVEPALSPDGKVIDLQLCPQHVSFLGYQRFEFGRGADGTADFLTQPRFFTNKLTTNLSVPSGKPVFLGSFPKAEKQDWQEVFILRVTAKPVK